MLATTGFNLRGDGGKELQQATQVSSDILEDSVESGPIIDLISPQSAVPSSCGAERQRQVSTVGKFSFGPLAIFVRSPE